MSDGIKMQVDDLEDDAAIEQQQQGAPKEKDPIKPTETEELRAAVSELAATVKVANTPKEKEDAPLTQDQKDELWAVYNPEKTRADFMRKFFRMNDDATPEQVAEAKELFGDMQKGLVRQSIVGARNFIDVEMQKIRDEFKGLSEYVVEQKAKEVRNNFQEAYPALSDKKYAKVVTAIANTLKDKDYANNDAYFKELAERSADVIKGFDETFDLGAEKAKTKTAGTTPKLPRTNAGGQGGAGGGANVIREKSSKDDINSLDDD